MNITIYDTDKTYRANVTPEWARRNDNGSLISTGIWVEQGDISRRQLETLRKAGRLTEISRDEANHSSCQSEHSPRW